MTNGTGGGASRSQADTSRFTLRRVRSAFFLWRNSIRGADVIATIVLVALSLGLGAYLFMRARAAVRFAFADRAQRLQAGVTEKLKQPSDDLETLSHFIEASGRVTRRQFAVFAVPMLLNDKSLYALEWLPVVPASERAAYEAEAHAAGLTDYRIWQQASDGRPEPVSARPAYVPIHYMEPPNIVALGFDVTSDPTRRATADGARDAGQQRPSPPFGLVEDAGAKGTLPAVALYRPIFRGGDPGAVAARRAALEGYALAVFRVAPLVSTAATTADAAGLGFSLRDVEAGAGPLMAERPTGAAALPKRPDFALVFPVQCAGRSWSLDVFALPGAFVTPGRGALEVASVGVLAALLSFVTVTSLRTISRLRRQVEKVGPYRLIARLGHGAMGVVWEARHALLRRPTAVKLLAPGTEGERSLARFEREVQLTAGLTHPSTIAIYDYGRTSGGVFYYAMELLRGINLLQLVAFDGPLPPARVVHLLRQACGALAEAHSAGLIHRDIKPANLMICAYGGIPDFLKVLDFGLVKDLGAVDLARQGARTTADSDAGLSQDGTLLGTPLYLAPEGMTDPGSVDVRADLFALGAVGYFLLTGGSPFPGHTALEVFARERKGPPVPLSSAPAHPVPACLEETLLACLAFDRDARPASAEKLDGMLEACVIAPPWRTEDARAWWRDRGPAALEAARGQREERGEILALSSDSRRR